MERSDAVTVILARIMKMVDRLGEGLGSLEDPVATGELTPIPIRAGRLAEPQARRRLMIDRDDRFAIARRRASRW